MAISGNVIEPLMASSSVQARESFSRDPDLSNYAYSPKTNTTATIDTTSDAMDMAVSKRLHTVSVSRVGRS